LLYLNNNKNFNKLMPFRTLVIVSLCIFCAQTVTIDVQAQQEGGSVSSESNPQEMSESERRVKITELLEQAGQYFSDNKVELAEKTAKEVLEMDPANIIAKSMLRRINESKEAEAAGATEQQKVGTGSGGGTGEKEMVRKRAEHVSSYLERARRYARRAVDTGEEEPEGKEFSQTEKQRVLTEEEEKKGMIAELEARRRAEEARKMAFEETEKARRTKRVKEYITSVHSNLQDNNFEKARIYARRALELDRENAEIKLLLTKINAEERTYEEKQEELRREEEARLRREEEGRQAEAEEARRKVFEERERERRTRRIAEYLREAQSNLAKDEFTRARTYAKRALELDGNNGETQAILARIDEKEKTQYDADRQSKLSEKERRLKEIEARRKLEAEEDAIAAEAEKTEIARRAKLIDEYLTSARGAYTKDNFSRARSYAQKALDIEPGNKKAAAALTDIKDAEEAYFEEQKRIAQGEAERKEAEEKVRQAEAEAQRSEEAARKEAEEKTRRLREQEAKEQKLVQQIAEYVGEAYSNLEQNKFDKARVYAKRAMEIAGDPGEFRALLAQVDQNEKEYNDVVRRKAAEQKQLAEEKERQDALMEMKGAKRKLKETGKTSKYLEEAREYAQKALEEDENNVEARQFLASIEKIESERKAAEARKKAEAEAERKRKEEAARRAAEETERIRLARRIDSYLKKANEYLARDDFSRARTYVQRSLDLNKDDAEAVMALQKIEARENAYKSEQERIRLRAEEKKKAEEEAMRKQDEVEEARRKAVESVKYLEEAREYAKKALEVDKDNVEARKLLENIEKAEAERNAAEERKIAEAEARKKAAGDAARRAREEREAARRAQDIAGYLAKSNAYLSENDFTRAQSYVQKALDIESGNEKALEMKERVETRERAYREEQERINAEERAKREASEKAAREAAEKAQAAKRAERIGRYLASARKSLEQDNFNKALSYTRRALDLDENNAESLVVMNNIEEAKSAYALEEERKRQERAAREKALLEAKRQAALEEEATRRARRAKTYLADARELFEKNDFDRARVYVRRALEADPANEAAKGMLIDVERAESEYKAELERMRLAEEETRKAEASAKYLEEAREYAKKALAADKDNVEARNLLESIEKAEAARKQEEERKRAEAEARRKAEEEAARRAREEKEAAERVQQINEYLTEANGCLAENDFIRARSRVQKALDLEPGNDRALETAERVKTGEAAYRQEKERVRAQEEAERKAAEEASRRAAEEAKRRKLDQKIEGYLGQAEESLQKNNFSRARKYGQRAQRLESGNDKTLEILDRINKTESAYKEEAKRKEAEAEALRKAEAAAGYLEQARGYAEKAFAADKTNTEALQLLEGLDSVERNKRAGEELKIRQEEDARKAEEDARKRKKEEAASRQQNKRIADHLAKARDSLKKNNFKRARSYTQKAFEISPGNTETQEVAEIIDEAERAYKLEKERKRTDEEAERRVREEKLLRKEEESRVRKLSDAEARMVAREKVAAEKRAKKINGYLQKARQHIGKGKTKYAQGYIDRVLELDPSNSEAMELASQIGDAYRKQAEEKALKKVEATKRGSREAQREQARKEKTAKRIDGRISAYTSKSRKFFENKDYENARKYAYLAWKQVPHDEEVSLLIAEIDREEIFANKNKKEEENKMIAAKAGTAAQDKKDPFHEYDEPKTWMEYMPGRGRKKFELTEMEKGRVYSVDECVHLALQRSQRNIVVDKQVKLAKARLVEAYRELAPELTLKHEIGYSKVGDATFGVRHTQGKKIQAEIKHTMQGLSTFYKIRQNQTNLEIVKMERSKIRNEIVEKTKVAYYSLDKTIKALDVQRKLKERVNHFYEISEKAHQDDLIPRVEYFKIKGQSAQADFQYISTEADIELARLMLFQNMNMEPDPGATIRPMESPDQFVTIGMENCQRIALANNPKLKIKERTIEYYKFERKMAKSKSWPKVEFHSSIGKSKDNYQPTDTSTGSLESTLNYSPEWFAGIKVNIPAFGNTFEYNYVREKWAPGFTTFKGEGGNFGTESNTNYFNIKILDDLGYFSTLAEARAGFESSKYEYLKAKKDLLTEVNERYFKYKKALLQLDVSKKKAEHQAMYVEVLDEKRRQGDMEISRVVEECEKLATEEYSVIDGEASYFISIAEINKTIGVSDYFVPMQENREYEKWKETREVKIAEKAAAAKKQKEKKTKTQDKAEGVDQNFMYYRPGVSEQNVI